MPVELDPAFRPATEADIPAMLRVFRAAFPRWPAVPLVVPPEDHIRWKMASHPRAADTNTVILVGDRIVGAAIQFCREIWVRGELMYAHGGADLAIHPDFQRRQFMSKAQPYAERAVFSQFDFTFNTASNHPRLKARQAARGEHLPFGNSLRVFITAFGARSFVATHMRSGGPRQLVSAGVRAVRQRVPGQTTLESGQFELETLDAFDERADALWERTAPSFDFIADRRANFLNWRHCDPRGGEALVRAATDGHRLLGYAVLRSGESASILADLLVEPGRDDVLRALIADAVAHARDRSSSLSCALPRLHPYVAAIEAAGFIDDGRGARLQYFPHGDSDSDLKFLGAADARLHVTLANFDYV